MDNPLLATDGLPAFDSIRAAHAEPAIRTQIDANRKQLDALLASGADTFAALVEPLEDMQHRLNRTWSPIGHLNYVMNSPELRAAYNACLPLISEYQTALDQNETLYRRYLALKEATERPGAEPLTPEQRKVIDNKLRDFRLTGVGLDDERKARFAAIMQELAQCQAKFEENVLDCANAWSRHITAEAELAGLPAPTIERARALAKEKNLDGWLLTLDQPTYMAVVTHAEHRPLRRELYEAWTTRASDRGPNAGRWDNTALIGDILRLRHEMAQLLGLTDYAALSLATKMAKSPADVRAFLENLADRSVPAAHGELKVLSEFAGMPLEAWDVAFYSERLQRQRFDVSEEQLRPYFPLPRVLDGLFQIAGRLYGIGIRERKDVSLWHPQVRYFDILSASGERLAGFYLDAYARPNKRNGAWMDECIGRLEFGGRRVLPVANLVCNFMPPPANGPALLTHSEVVTLFHEFGHGLHHMLTRVGYPSVAGISGVEWDAVELPSQFMENFAWSAETLPLISGHIDTGAPLPKETIERLNGTRTFQAAMATVRQLEFSLFDLRVHTEYQPERGPRIAEILQDVRNRVAVIAAPEFSRTAHNFSHIFAGGYAAGYYSYKWAQVLAADAFSAFEEEGLFNPATSGRFLDAILSRGGSRRALESFVAFRGREPDIQPLLKQLGIAA